MMELYENSVDLNFKYFNVNLNGEQEDEEAGRDMDDLIMFNGSDSASCGGNPIKQRSQANARERFRTHRFVSMI